MSRARANRRGRRAVAYGGLAVSGVAGTAAVAATGVAAYFARQVVTPPVVKPDDLEILEVRDGEVVLTATADSVVPGRYGIWLQGGQGHVRVGEVVSSDLQGGTVTRTVETVESGRLEPGPARWNQYYVAGDPTTAWGIAHDDVSIPSEVGDLPCWVVPPDPADDSGHADVWALLIHGRGATREECLRGVPVLHRMGLTVAVPAYRNDRDAPGDRSGRYHFGGTEWRDIESVLLWALEHGARRIVLVGWSMGGAIALQLISRSWTADRVIAVVLDSPVVDWQDVLDHTARLNRVPPPVGRLAQQLVRHRQLRRVVGLGEPVDLRTLDWVRRADELAVPVLIMHSDADDVVPIGPSLALAAARPDVITLAPWTVARHTKEWNTEPERWESLVEEFVSRAR